MTEGQRENDTEATANPERFENRGAPRGTYISETIHNPDRYMVDLRQILSQGRKRIGLLLGAGAPAAVKIGADGKIDNEGAPLIPDVARLTTFVIEALKEGNSVVVQAIRRDLEPKYGPSPNIEAVLSRIRLLSQAIGNETVHGLDAGGYDALGKTIADLIGSKVGARLPNEPTPFSELVAWVGGTNRDCPVEIFTPNYDLLLEEAFERATFPYFDGFSGGHEPFFDPPSVASSDTFPSRWSRLWKLHGSLGWEVRGDRIVRTGSRVATQLIYPDHLKYDSIQRLPYSALFERLRAFLMTPDCLLLCSGFSFFDAHICSIIEESLVANPHAAVFAFQYQELAKEKLAVDLARMRPNLSVYAKDGAVISGVRGDWRPGQSPTKDWPEIRNTFWGLRNGETQPHFLLGDFVRLARFCSMAQSIQLATSTGTDAGGTSTTTETEAVC